MAESLYDALGVAKDASADDIRKAYRKLAREHHPDVNPGDKAAEEKFKRIASAYDVLSDDKKRKAYDEFGDDALAGGFDPDKAREYQKWQGARQQQRSARYDQGPSEFDFADFFGGGAGGAGFGGFGGGARGPGRGHDLQAELGLTLRQAIEGAEVGFEVPGQGTVRVRVPPGADTGSTIRLAGKGAPGRNGGPAGDLVIEMSVEEHPVLRRDGLDLHQTIALDLDEAYNGATVEVPTFDGPVLLKVPARSQPGAKLRLRGKGVPRKDQRGDMIVELSVRLPDKPDDALAAALRASKAAYSAPVRSEVTL